MNFAPLANDLFLRALAQQPVDSTPVWMMRQAGRYLPEYLASRAQAGDFLELCKNTDLACEVTLQPLRRYALDAAILFSDILTVPDAMGLGLYFEAGEGPKFKHVVRTEQAINALPTIGVADQLGYVYNAVTAIRHALGGKVPLIGFAGSPWTLATYMIEGGSSRDFRHSKTMMYQSPELLHTLLSKLASVVTDYLNRQIAAGAQAIQIFDSWGGALAHQEYLSFSLPYMQQIINGLTKHAHGRDVPVILFSKGGGQWLQAMANTGAQGLGIDWTTSLAQARNTVGNRITLQGNLDPHVLLGSPQSIVMQTQAMLAQAYAHGHYTGYIANLGHGITQWTNPSNAAVFIDTVKSFKIPN